MRLTSLASLCFLAINVGACGDDDDGGGRVVYESGVRDDATAATLGDDDKRKFCSSFDAHVRVSVSFEEIARVACLPGAFLFGGSKEGCQDRLDACVRNTPKPIVVDATVNDQRVCFQNLSTCEASVGQLEGCVNVSVDDVLDTLERVTCARYGDAEVREEANRRMTGETVGSCAKLSGTCGNAVNVSAIPF